MILRPLSCLAFSGFLLAPFSSTLVADTYIEEHFAYPVGVLLDQTPVAGITSYGLQNDVKYPVQSEDLTYGILPSTGGSLTLDGGGTALWFFLDTSEEGPFGQASLLDNQGRVGADDNQLYIAYVFQLDSANTDKSQFLVRFGRGDPATNENGLESTNFFVGQNWQTNEFRIQSTPIAPIDTQPHLVVLRISLAQGTDTVDLFFDPPLGVDEGLLTPTATVQRTVDLETVLIVNQGNNGRLDTLRFASTYADAIGGVASLPPVAPENLAARALGPNRVVLTWDDAALGESSYSVQRAGSPSGPFATIANLPADANSFNDTTSGLFADTSYTYRVFATNADGMGDFAEVTVQTLPEGVTVPDAPTSLSAILGEANALELSWDDAASDERGYRIYIATSADGPFRRENEYIADTTAASTRPLAANTTYWVKVRAFGLNGESADSPVMQVTTGAPIKSGAEWVWWEGEAYTTTTTSTDTTWLNPGNDLALQNVLSDGEGFGYGLSADEIANGFRHVITYDIEIPSTGTYTLYLRRPSQYGWFGWSFNGPDAQDMTLVRDPTQLERIDYRGGWPMAWIQLGQADLAAGSHTLSVVLDSTFWPEFADELDNARVRYYFFDAFLATQIPFTPQGKLPPGTVLAEADSGMWPFEPGTDPLTEEALFDLRHLNEAVAGENGFITRDGDKFINGYGDPIRFWGVNITANDLSLPVLTQQAEFLAKRGVNLVRWHSNVYSNSASDLSVVNASAVDSIHRSVAAYKQAGIYTLLSPYFMLNMRIQPEWGIDGFDADFLEGYDRGAYGLIYFDETFQEAYRTWMRAIFDETNPYTGTRNAEEPAIAILELTNEDNLFWFSFDLAQLPNAQVAKLEGLFYDFLVDKYGSLEEAYNAWGGEVILNGDDPASGRLSLTATNVIGTTSPSGAPAGRVSDNIEWRATLQAGWYTQTIDWLRQELGLQCLFIGSNWRTSKDEILLDLERWTYTHAGVIDLHNYYNAGRSQTETSYDVRVGDAYYRTSATFDPSALSTNYEQVRGHPSVISEFSWVNPTDLHAESFPLSSALGAMNDIDALVWFSWGQKLGFSTTLEKWNIGTPSTIGQSPAAALLYRLGHLLTAPVVVAEGRSLASLYAREESLITQGAGFDPTRDNEYDPETGEGQVDTYAHLVGKVEVNFDGDQDVIRTADLDRLIDRDGGTIASYTQELQFDLDNGLFTIDSFFTQGATGHLGRIGTIELSDVLLRLDNDFGALMVAPLDARPLRRSRELLLQTAVPDRPNGYRTADANLSGDIGQRITDLGRPPWNVEEISGQVTLKGITAANNPVATVLDPNGYPLQAPLSEFTQDGYVITLPFNALYVHVALEREENPFDTFPAEAGGWLLHPTWGRFWNPSMQTGWVYHDDFAWVFLHEEFQHEAFWAYHPQLQWVWHGSNAVNWLWVNDENAWWYYWPGSEGWFWEQSQGWFQIGG